MKLINKFKRHWNAWRKTRISHQEAKELTLYPELPHKKLSQIRRELFWLCRNPRRSSFTMEATILDYFNMGLDRVGENPKQYVFRMELHRARNMRQPISCWTLKDKWVTALYLDSYGIATTRPLFVKTPFVSNDEALQKIRNSGETHFFAKPVDSSLGLGAFPFSIDGDKFVTDDEIISDEDLLSKLEGCIVEPRIEQHDELNRLYPHAVSSHRIVTICHKGQIDICQLAFGVGTGGMHMSNIYQGGILLDISIDGVLGDMGIKLKGERGRLARHPDTGVEFKGFKIPYWKEALDLAIRAHQCFPKIHSVGWDIAISKDGPLIIEGNQHWVPHSFQYTNGPGREYMKKWFRLRS